MSKPQRSRGITEGTDYTRIAGFATQPKILPNPVACLSFQLLIRINVVNSLDKHCLQE